MGANRFYVRRRRIAGALNRAHGALHHRPHLSFLLGGHIGIVFNLGHGRVHFLLGCRALLLHLDGHPGLEDPVAGCRPLFKATEAVVLNQILKFAIGLMSFQLAQ